MWLYFRLTIAAPIQRLYEPDKGEIKIGGKDVDEIDNAITFSTVLLLPTAMSLTFFRNAPSQEFFSYSLLTERHA
jgi:ABC-type transport system involved in Fe-S cluster assembly fused permease/ATPase subunit